MRSCALNPHVRGATRGKPSVMPCQVVRGRVASAVHAIASGGVSSFGYSGTIAHAVLAFGSGDGRETPAIRCDLDASEVALSGCGAPRRPAGVIPARCLHSTDGARHRTLPRPPLAYRRRRFQWCDHTHQRPQTLSVGRIALCLPTLALRRVHT